MIPVHELETKDIKQLIELLESKTSIEVLLPKIVNASLEAKRFELECGNLEQPRLEDVCRGQCKAWSELLGLHDLLIDELEARKSDKNTGAEKPDEEDQTP